MPPHKASFIDDLVVMLPQNVWDHLYSRWELVCLLRLLHLLGKMCGVFIWYHAVFSDMFLTTHRYGGGPAVNHLYVCHTCQMEIEKLEKRRKTELDMFVRVGHDLSGTKKKRSFYTFLQREHARDFGKLFENDCRIVLC